MNLLKTFLLEESKIFDDIDQAKDLYNEIYSYLTQIENDYDEGVDVFSKYPMYKTKNEGLEGVGIVFNSISNKITRLKTIENTFRLLFLISKKKGGGFFNADLSVSRKVDTINNQKYIRNNIWYVGNLTIAIRVREKALGDLLSNLAYNLANNKNTFTHEFIHMIQNIKSKGYSLINKRDKYLLKNLRNYINQRIELEAYFKDNLKIYYDDKIKFDKIFGFINKISDTEKNYLKNNFKSYHNNDVNHLAKTYDSPLASNKIFYEDFYSFMKKNIRYKNNLDLDELLFDKSKKYLVKLINKAYYELIDRLKTNINKALQES
jgi:hypothetical protein